MSGTINTTVAHVKAHARVVAFKAIGRKVRQHRERAERVAAGDLNGGAPMSRERRRAVYAAQTGHVDRGSLAWMTPAQRRRHNKKLMHEMVRQVGLHMVDEVA